MSRVYYVILSNIIVLSMTIIGVLIANVKGITQEHLLNICYILLGICISILLLLHFREVVKTWRKEKFQAGIIESVSSFVIMKKRKDVFRIKDNNSASLFWHFDIETNFEEPVRELTFPIYAEKSEDDKGNSVELVSLRIDGNFESTHRCYRAQSLRQQYNGSNIVNGPIMEFGLLHVPVNLKKGISSCSVEIQLDINDAFPNLYDKEYVIVDIPYITRELEVEIHGEGDLLIKKPDSHDDHIIIAVPANTEQKDFLESNKQNNNWAIIGNKFIWETSYPKIGHRYSIYFRAEQAKT